MIRKIAIIILIILIPTFAAQKDDSFNEFQNEINKLINLATIYNPEILKYDQMLKENYYLSQSIIYEKEKMISIGTSIDTNNFLPNKKEPMSGLSIMYSLKKPNNLQESFRTEIINQKIIETQKLQTLNNIAKSIKTNLLNIITNKQLIKKLEEIERLYKEILELAKNDYKYSKSKLSQIYSIISEIYNIQTEKVKLNQEIINNKIEIYNLIGIPTQIEINTENLEINQNIEQKIFNNPELKIKNLQIEKTKLEIEKEKKKSENQFSIEYMFRPQLPSMIYLRYSLILPNKNQQQLLINSINWKLENLKTEYQQNYKELYYQHLQILKQIEYTKIELNITQENIKNVLKQIEQLKVEYQYNKTELNEIIEAIKDLKNLQINELKYYQSINLKLIELKYLNGQIFE